MSTAVMTLFGAVGSVAAMLAVLVPVILVQGKSLRREIDAQGGHGSPACRRACRE